MPYVVLGGGAAAPRAEQDLRGSADPVRAADRGQEPGEQGDDPARRPHEDAGHLRRDHPALGRQGRRGAAPHVRRNPPGAQLCGTGEFCSVTHLLGKTFR